MPGMSLKTGLHVGGSYTPLTPASTTPASTGATLSQQAFGINGTGAAPHGPKTAALGTVAIGIASVAALCFIWYSLPR